jgi:hypothetical protein
LREQKCFGCSRIRFDIRQQLRAVVSAEYRIGNLIICTLAAAFLVLATVCSVIGFILAAMGRSSNRIEISILGTMRAVVGTSSRRSEQPDGDC